MDKLGAIRTFVTIVDAGSLTEAASRLGKAVPTVVRSLSSLEAALGVRLLARTTRRMSLTEEGRLYAERCRRILADLAETEAALGQPNGPPRGELRVTAPVLFGRLKVLPAVTSFLQAHAEVTVDLLLLDRVVNLVEEGIDVGIRIAPLPDSSVIARRVGQMRRVVVGSPALLRRVGTPKQPDDLRGRPVIDFRREGAGPSDWSFTRPQGGTIAVPVHGRLTCNQAAAALDACAAGLGFGRFLHYQVESLVAARTLRIVLTGFEPPPVPVHVVYPHARLLSPRTRAFVDWLQARL